MSIDRLTTPWWALRVALGAAAFLAGLDKFFNLLADWPGYVSPLATSVLPVSTATLLHLVGIDHRAVEVDAPPVSSRRQVAQPLAVGWVVDLHAAVLEGIRQPLDPLLPRRVRAYQRDRLGQHLRLGNVLQNGREQFGQGRQFLVHDDGDVVVGRQRPPQGREVQRPLQGGADGGRRVG